MQRWCLKRDKLHSGNYKRHLRTWNKTFWLKSYFHSTRNCEQWLHLHWFVRTSCFLISTGKVQQPLKETSAILKDPAGSLNCFSLAFPVLTISISILFKFRRISILNVINILCIIYSALKWKQIFTRLVRSFSRKKNRTLNNLSYKNI